MDLCKYCTFSELTLEQRTDHLGKLGHGNFGYVCVTKFLLLLTNVCKSLFYAMCKKLVW